MLKDFSIFQPGRTRKAFTLIELILVMALLGIVLAVSAPSLSKFFRGRTLASEARQFVSLTRYGQSRAVTEGVPMRLWMDTRRGAYGLQEEPGYMDVDNKKVEFTLAKDLTINVAETGQTARPRQGAQTDSTIATLQFQPDGFISESSPRSVVIKETSGESLWITQSRSRLNYEIQTNSFQNTHR